MAPITALYVPQPEADGLPALVPLMPLVVTPPTTLMAPITALHAPQPEADGLPVPTPLTPSVVPQVTIYQIITA